MAVDSNTFTTFIDTGMKEQVSDLIHNISPRETPFLDGTSKFPVHNRLIQWQTDTLQKPGANAQLEGDVISGAAAFSSATSLLSNRTQISDKSLVVSRTTRNTSSHGRGDEYEYQIMKRGAELKTDVEFGLLKNQVVDAGSIGTARVCSGFTTFIANIVGLQATAASQGLGTTAVSLITATTLAYSDLASAMTMAYDAGGNPTKMMLTPTLKRAFSALAFSATPSTADVRFNISGAQKPIAVGTVDGWLSDFGQVDVVVNRVMSRQTTDTTILQKSIYMIDPEHVRVGVFQDFELIPLGQRGLADEAALWTEYSLEVGSPNAHAIVIGKTP